MKGTTALVLGAAIAGGVFLIIRAKRSSSSDEPESDEPESDEPSERVTVPEPGHIGPDRLTIGRRHRFVYHVRGVPSSVFLEQMLGGLEAGGASDVSLQDGDPMVLEFTGPPAVSELEPPDPMQMGPVVMDLQFFEVV